jgi:hypothetical protein
MAIKLLFKQGVDRTVEVKREAWRPRNPKFVVDIKASCAI